MFIARGWAAFLTTGANALENGSFWKILSCRVAGG
jgi:hypothetical protein